MKSLWSVTVWRQGESKTVEIESEANVPGEVREFLGYLDGLLISPQ